MARSSNGNNNSLIGALLDISAKLAALTVTLIMGSLLYLTPHLHRVLVWVNHRFLPYGHWLGIFLSGVVWGGVGLAVAVLPIVFLTRNEEGWTLFWLVSLGGYGFGLGLAAGEQTHKEREQGRRLSSQPLPGRSPVGFVTPEDYRYTAIASPVRLALAVPKGALVPVAATQFISGLAALGSLISLEIEANEDGITFTIVSPKDRMAQAKQVVLGAYPKADIREINPHWSLQGSTIQSVSSLPGLGYVPLRKIGEFSGTDPLAGLLQAMSNLGAGERVIWQYVLRPAQYTEWAHLGAQAISQLVARERRSSRAPQGQVDPRQPFVRAGVRVYQEKLGRPLLEVMGRVAVIADDGRKETILEGMKAALAAWDSGHNRLGLYPVGDSPAQAMRQREFNATLPLERDWRVMVLASEEMASLFHMPSEQVQVAGIHWQRLPAAPAPIAATRAQEGVCLGTNLYQGVARPVYLRLEDRELHINMLGRTGVGKTTLMHNIVQGDLVNGRGVAVIEPHGAFVQAVLESIPEEREDDVVLVDLADVEYPVGLGLFSVPEGVSKEEAAGILLLVIKKIYASDWSATRMESGLSAALRTLLDVEGATLMDIPRLFEDARFRKKAVGRTDDLAALEYWRHYERMTTGMQEQIAPPILHRIRVFYRNKAVRNLTCQARSLDFKEIIDSGKILLVSLAGAEVQSEMQNLGSLIISKLQLAAMSRAVPPFGQRAPYFITIDEAQTFTTTSLSKMFAEVRKFGIALTVGNQYASQLEGDTLESILGNSGTTILFRLGPRDARAMAPVVEPEFNARDLENLDRFQCVVKMQAKGEVLPAFSIMAPLPVSEKREGAAQRIRDLSRQKYARPRAEVEAEIDHRLRPSRGITRYE